MTIKEGRDVAAILGVLRDSFCNSTVDNGVIASLILMDEPIAQPGALGNAQSKGHGEHSCLRCFDKGVIVILGRRARSGAGAAPRGGVGSVVCTGQGEHAV
jgi:hypothetical protein